MAGEGRRVEYWVKLTQGRVLTAAARETEGRERDHVDHHEHLDHADHPGHPDHQSHPDQPVAPGWSLMDTIHTGLKRATMVRIEQ